MPKYIQYDLQEVLLVSAVYHGDTTGEVWD